MNSVERSTQQNLVLVSEDRKRSLSPQPLSSKNHSKENQSEKLKKILKNSSFLINIKIMALNSLVGASELSYIDNIRKHSLYFDEIVFWTEFCLFIESILQYVCSMLQLNIERKIFLSIWLMTKETVLVSEKWKPYWSQIQFWTSQLMIHTVCF